MRGQGKRKKAKVRGGDDEGDFRGGRRGRVLCVGAAGAGGGAGAADAGHGTACGGAGPGDAAGDHHGRDAGGGDDAGGQRDGDDSGRGDPVDRICGPAHGLPAGQRGGTRGASGGGGGEVRPIARGAQDGGRVEEVFVA